MSGNKEPYPQSFYFDFDVLLDDLSDSVSADQLRQALVVRLASLSDEQLLKACYVDEEEPWNFSGLDRAILERFHKPDTDGGV